MQKNKKKDFGICKRSLRGWWEGGDGLWLVSVPTNTSYDCRRLPETLGMGMRVEDLMDTTDLTGRVYTERPLPDEFHQKDPAFRDTAQ